MKEYDTTANEFVQDGQPLIAMPLSTYVMSTEDTKVMFHRKLEYKRDTYDLTFEKPAFQDWKWILEGPGIPAIPEDLSIMLSDPMCKKPRFYENPTGHPFWFCDTLYDKNGKRLYTTDNFWFSDNEHAEKSLSVGFHFNSETGHSSYSLSAVRSTANEGVDPVMTSRIALVDDIVIRQPSDEIPNMDGENADAGKSDDYARGDHVHPRDEAIGVLEQKVDNGFEDAAVQRRELKDSLLDVIETKVSKENAVRDLKLVATSALADVRCNSIIRLSDGTLLGGFEDGVKDENYVAWYDEANETWVKSTINGDHPNFEVWSFAEKDGVVVCNEYGSWVVSDNTLRIYYSTDFGRTFTQVTLRDDEHDINFNVVSKTVIVVKDMFVIPVFTGGDGLAWHKTKPEWCVNYVYSFDGKNWRFPAPDLATYQVWNGAQWLTVHIYCTSPMATLWRDDGFVTLPYENSPSGLKYLKYNYDFDPNCTDPNDPAYSPFIRITPPGYATSISPGSFYEANYCTDNYLIVGGANAVYVSEDRGITWRQLKYGDETIKSRALCKVDDGYVFGLTDGRLLFSSNLVDFINISIDELITENNNTIRAIIRDGDGLLIASTNGVNDKSIYQCAVTYSEKVPKVLVDPRDVELMAEHVMNKTMHVKQTDKDAWNAKIDNTYLANDTRPGLVQPDGTSITIDDAGVIHAVGEKGDYLPLAGGNMSGDIVFETNRIINKDSLSNESRSVVSKAVEEAFFDEDPTHPRLKYQIVNNPVRLYLIDDGKQYSDFTDIVVPETVEHNGEVYTPFSIDFGAFQENQNLRSIVLPNSVKIIGYSAFNSCINLSSIEMPGVVKISQAAFYNCRSLESVVFCEQLTELEGEVFSYCTSLSSITFLGNFINEFGTEIFQFNSVFGYKDDYESCTGNPAGGNKLHVKRNAVGFDDSLIQYMILDKSRGNKCFEVSYLPEEHNVATQYSKTGTVNVKFDDTDYETVIDFPERNLIGNWKLNGTVIQPVSNESDEIAKLKARCNYYENYLSSLYNALIANNTLLSGVIDAPSFSHE